jgi:Kelch motif
VTDGQIRTSRPSPWHVRASSPATNAGSAKPVLSGLQQRRPDGTSDLTTVEAYDPVANTWTTLPELPEARSDGGVAFADGRLVAVGGESGGQVLKSVAALDLATRTWSDLPDMDTARHGMAVAAVEKTVYAIGGATGVGDSQVTSSAEALKLAARKPQPASQWRSLPDAPTARLMMAWTVLDGQIWIAGGMSHGTTLDTVQSYDPQTGAWQTQPSLPIPLHHATAATYRGEVVVIGAPATTSRKPRTRCSRCVKVSGWSYRASSTPGQRRRQRSLVTSSWLLGVRTISSSSRRPKCSTESPGIRQPTCRPRANTLLRCRTASTCTRWAGGSSQPTRTPRRLSGSTRNPGNGSSWWTCRLRAEATAPRTSTVITPMRTPRHGEVVAAVGSTVYCIGGADRPTHEGPVSTVEALDFS